MLEINKIYNGDCLDLLKNTEDKSVSLILADLPFVNVLAPHWNKAIDLKSLWVEIWRVLKPDGNVLHFATPPFNVSLTNSTERKYYKYSWYWEKNIATNFYYAKAMPLRCIEEILLFKKEKCWYHPQMTITDIPSKKVKSVVKNKAYHGINERDDPGGRLERYPLNILKFDVVPSKHRLHSSQKPTDLLEYFIKTYSNENDLILDPTVGCGSTAIACLNTKRNFIGFEKDLDIFNTAIDRISDHEKKGIKL